MGVGERQADGALEAGGGGCGGAEAQDGSDADASQGSAEVEGGAGCECDSEDQIRGSGAEKTGKEQGMLIVGYDIYRATSQTL